MKRLALISVLLIGCGTSDDPADLADASVSGDDASLSGDDASTSGADASTGPVDAMAASPCTPSLITMAEDPAQAGDYTSGITVDPSSGACAVENGTDFDANRVVFLVLRNGQLGAGTSLGRSIQSTSHAMTTGTYAGPLPDQTTVTIRVLDQSTGTRWDISFNFNRALKTVRVTQFDVVTGS